MYYPLTAYFVLFCNVVTTANLADFQLLGTIADCLGHSGSISPQIAQLQSLFRELVALAQCFLPRDHRPVADDANLSTVTTMPSQVHSEDARSWPSWPYWAETNLALPVTMVSSSKDDNAAFLDFPAWDSFLEMNVGDSFVGNDLGN